MLNALDGLTHLLVTLSEDHETLMMMMIILIIIIISSIIIIIIIIIIIMIIMKPQDCGSGDSLTHRLSPAAFALIPALFLSGQAACGTAAQVRWQRTGQA